MIGCNFCSVEVPDRRLGKYTNWQKFGAFCCLFSSSFGDNFVDLSGALISSSGLLETLAQKCWENDSKNAQSLQKIPIQKNMH